MRKSLSENYYLLVCLALGIVCIVHFFSFDDYYPYLNYPPKMYPDNNPSNIYNMDVAMDTATNQSSLFEFLYDNRKEHYQETLGTLGTSINRLALLVLIALLLLYFKPSDIELFGVKIPNLAVYVVLPVCILYYWLLFGFSLFNAIASRDSLFHLSAQIEKQYFQDRKSRIASMHTSKNSLEDISIVDAWSNVFLGYYEEDYDKVLAKKRDKDNKKKIRANNIAVAVGLFVIFGGLQGLAMGCALSMIYYYKQRFKLKKRKRIILFEALLFLYFLLSHVTFFVTMPYSSLYLASIWFIGAGFFYLALRPLRLSAAQPVTE